MNLLRVVEWRGAEAAAAVAALSAGIVTRSSGSRNSNGISRRGRRGAAVAATSAGVVVLSGSCSNGISARVGRERRTSASLVHAALTIAWETETIYTTLALAAAAGAGAAAVEPVLAALPVAGVVRGGAAAASTGAVIEEALQ